MLSEATIAGILKFRETSSENDAYVQDGLIEHGEALLLSARQANILRAGLARMASTPGAKDGEDARRIARETLALADNASIEG